MKIAHPSNGWIPLADWRFFLGLRLWHSPYQKTVSWSKSKKDPAGFLASESAKSHRVAQVCPNRYDWGAEPDLLSRHLSHPWKLRVSEAGY
jgi:hypothetical protein